MNCLTAKICWNLFEENQTFNEDISGWNVSNVTDMRIMFYNARAFNQPLNDWDTSKVTNMENMSWHFFTIVRRLSSQYFQEI